MLLLHTLSVGGCGVLAGGAHVPVFFEIAIGLIVEGHSVDFADHFVALDHSLSLFEIFGLSEAAYFVHYFFRLDLSVCVYFYLEQLHPTCATYWIFGQHAGDQGLHEGRDWAGEVQILAVQYLYQIGDRV